jgi:hypothetical protein
LTTIRANADLLDGESLHEAGIRSVQRIRTERRRMSRFV